MAIYTNRQPSYFAVIPANVRYSKDVCDGAKLLYAEITSLCNAQGFCWATNAYFADLYGKSTDTISRWISQLARAGFILTMIDNADGNSRKIWLSESQGTGKNAERVPAKMPRGYRQKSVDPIGKNADIIIKENNKMNSVSGTHAHAPEHQPLKAEKETPPPSSATPPPPPKTDTALTYDQYPNARTADELQERLRAYFTANPNEWHVGVLERAKAGKWPLEKTQEAVLRFCLHKEKSGDMRRTFGQYRADLTTWFLNQPRFDTNIDHSQQPQRIAFK